MMTIWWILKIMLFVILGLLGLLLFLVLLVLLVPVRYRADGSFYGKPRGKACVNWLLHLVSLNIKYEEKLNMQLKILGFPVGIPKKKEPEGDEEPAAEEILSDREDTSQETEQEKAVEHEAGSGSSQAAGEKPSQPAAEAEERRSAEKRQGKARKRKPSLKEKAAKLRQKICDRLNTAKDKWMSLKDKKDRLTAFISDKDNQRTLRLLKVQLFKIIRHILPVRLKGFWKFGFDDPFKTGQILTYAAPFYGFYAGKLELIPVFDEKVMEGELLLKGRIRLGTLTAYVLRMFFDKNFRLLIKKWVTRRQA